MKTFLAQKALLLPYMKKCILAICAVLMFQACSTDFPTGAPYEEVTIAYGLLDENDFNHYIKLTKGFYDPVGDNLIAAQNPDSIYYNDADVEVKIEELSGNSVTNSWILDRVDLVDEGVVKPSGIFPASPNYGYRMQTLINSDFQYRLTITNTATGKVIKGQTDLINTGSAFQIVIPFTAFDQLNFEDPLKTYTFIWQAPPGAGMFDLMLRFHYDERDLGTNIEIKKSIDLPLAQFIKRTNDEITFEMQNEQFYSLLTANLGAAGPNIVRYVDTPDFSIIGGSFDLQRYIEVNNAQGGLTNDQIKPNFTNLEGENVIGLFSSRGVRTLANIPLTPGTFDSVINSTRTANLNFVGMSSN